MRRGSPVEGSFSHSDYSIWLMVEGLGAAAQRSRLVAWWTSRWVHPPCTLPAGIGPDGGSQPAVKRQVLNLGQGCAECVRCGIAATAAVYAMRTRASDRAAGLPSERQRTGMARQHSHVVCICARPRRKRWASDTGEARNMMRGLGWLAC